VEREPVERDAVERAAVEREPPRDELAFVLREELPDAFDLVSATRSLSKSLSACLLVFAASRRSALSADVTSF
jgi:hypothetical protein